MTLRDALDATVNSTTKDAIKRPGMGGYFVRGPISTTEGSEGDFTLTMKNRAGTTYAYEYDASTGKWTAPSTKPEMTGEFFGELIADDWTIGTSTDFESARNPGQDDLW